MKTKLLKALILTICLMFTQNVFAEVEEEVIVVTKVPYSASLTKKSSTDSTSINPVSGVHTGLSSVYTLETNGGDENFDYIITSYIDIDGGRVSAFGNDGRLLFAHETTFPTSGAVDNAKSGSGTSKNVFAYPTTVNATNGMSASFDPANANYGSCYLIHANSSESSDITFTVETSPCSGTYELGRDESGAYKAVVVYTITSK